MYGKLHGIEIPTAIAQNGNPTTNVCMCGRWPVTLNYCNTEVTIPTIEGVLVFDISLESLSNTEVTILTTEGILVFDISLESFFQYRGHFYSQLTDTRPCFCAGHAYIVLLLLFSYRNLPSS